jgi:hypothetical protein
MTWAASGLVQGASRNSHPSVLSLWIPRIMEARLFAFVKGLVV